MPSLDFRNLFATLFMPYHTSSSGVVKNYPMIVSGAFHPPAEKRGMEIPLQYANTIWNIINYKGDCRALFFSGIRTSRNLLMLN
ncbi:MAG: hypothetical protein HQL69_20375 [Magnetococcales bacterium]|nr:hypothetical protein [Magnetococcales bacterium]